MTEATSGNQGSRGQEGDAAYNPNEYSSWGRDGSAPNASRSQDKYEQAKRAAGDSYAQARDTIKETSRQAQQYASDWTQQTRSATEDYVRDKPWNALGIAAAIGIVIGLILRR